MSSFPPSLPCRQLQFHQLEEPHIRYVSKKDGAVLAFSADVTEDELHLPQQKAAHNLRYATLATQPLLPTHMRAPAT